MNEDLRRWADALGTSEPTEAIAGLLRCSDDPEPILVDVALGRLTLQRREALQRAALVALRERGSPLLAAAGRALLEARRSGDRRLALEGGAPVRAEEIERVLATDPSHLVRSAAIAAAHPSDDALRFAASDPHWRVRAALVATHRGLERDQVGTDYRSEGVVAYLAGTTPSPMDAAGPTTVWDDDPAVIGAVIGTVEPSRLDANDVLRLITHEDARVSRCAGRRLLELDDLEVLTEAFSIDPRTPGLHRTLRHVAQTLNEDQKRHVAEAVLRTSPAIPILLSVLPWVGAGSAQEFQGHRSSLVRAVAIRRAQAMRALEDPSALVRRRAVELLADSMSVNQWKALDDDARSWLLAAHPPFRRDRRNVLSAALDDRNGAVRARAAERIVEEDIPVDLGGLIRDPDHRVRAWAVGRTRDPQLVDADPSPLVWAMHRTSVRAEARATSAGPPRASFAPSLPPQGAARRLGKTDLWVSRLGLSGHYGLPTASFRRALDAGITLYFWEPNYATQSGFFRDLSPKQRDSVVVVAGTFGCTPEEVRRDVDKALRLTRLERIDLFLVYWVRSWRRLELGALTTLRELRALGKIRAFSFSTHQRSLARQGIEEGFDPLMVRHNLAHRGVEQEVFPTAKKHQTGILTFSNLLYGRILRPTEGISPTPVECYAYSLSFNAVTATFTAPANHEQLRDNASAANHRLDPERRAALVAHGARVHRAERHFRQCIRSR
ncbi:MAG: aldo/keto reductase [Myxococcota bacterium]